jgi:hypothetical protein
MQYLLAWSLLAVRIILFVHNIFIELEHFIGMLPLEVLSTNHIRESKIPATLFYWALTGVYLSNGVSSGSPNFLSGIDFSKLEIRNKISELAIAVDCTYRNDRLYGQGVGFPRQIEGLRQAYISEQPYTFKIAVEHFLEQIHD